MTLTCSSRDCSKKIRKAIGIIVWYLINISTVPIAVTKKGTNQNGKRICKKKG